MDEETKRNLKRKGWVAFAIFFVGTLVGYNGSPEPEVITKTETETVTETVEVEVEVPAPYIPEPCSLAIELTLKMNDYSADLSYAAAEQLRILTESNIAVGSPQVENNNILKQDQIDLDRTSTEWRVNLDEDIRALNEARTSCDEEMQ